MATTFSNVDLSKVDWSQYEDEDDAPHGTAPPPQHHQQAAVGGDVPFDRMGLDDDDDFGEHDQTWRVTCVDERDVGCEFSLLGGAVTKKCLGAAQNPEPENPEDGWAVEIDYTACVCGAAKITEGGELDVAPVEGAEEPLPPFEQGVGSYFRLDAGMLPTGVEAAIKTMREGERALVTVQPGTHAFGDAGDATRSVPAESAVQYEVRLLRIIEVRTLRRISGTDRVVKRRLHRGPKWDRPTHLDEVVVRWCVDASHGSDGDEPPAGGVVPSVVASEELTFSLGDSTSDVAPPLLHEILLKGHINLGETAELTIYPTSGDASVPGFARFGAGTERPGAPLVLTLTLRAIQSIEDLSRASDGSLRKAVLQKGHGWERARIDFVTTIDLEVTKRASLGTNRRIDVDVDTAFGKVAKDGASAIVQELDSPPSGDLLAERKAIEVVIGQATTNEALKAIQRACGGGVDLPSALEIALKQMAIGEVCELRCSATPVVRGNAPSGGTGDHICMRVRMVEWVLVEPVPGTDHALVRRVIRKGEEEAYQRPNKLARVVVKYTVRAKDSNGGGTVLETTGDESRTFVVTEGPSVGVLPCIDVGVTEMQRGEVAIFTAPPEWAYANPEYEATESGGDTSHVAVCTEAGGVEVEVELLGFERGKDLYELSTDEKIESQAKYRAAGTKYYQAGLFAWARKRYEEANKRAVSESSFSSGVTAAEEVKQKVAESTASKLSCLLNIAQCNLKLGEWEKVIPACTDALALDAKSVKALYRRGHAHLKLGDVGSARADMTQAAQLDPQNRDVRRELEAVKAMEKAAKEKQKGMFGGMFSAARG